MLVISLIFWNWSSGCLGWGCFWCIGTFNLTETKSWWPKCCSNAINRLRGYCIWWWMRFYKGSQLLCSTLIEKWCICSSVFLARCSKGVYRLLLVASPLCNPFVVENMFLSSLLMHHTPITWLHLCLFLFSPKLTFSLQIKTPNIREAGTALTPVKLLSDQLHPASLNNDSDATALILCSRHHCFLSGSLKESDWNSCFPHRSCSCVMTYYIQCCRFTASPIIAACAAQGADCGSQFETNPAKMWWKNQFVFSMIF